MRLLHRLTVITDITGWTEEHIATYIKAWRPALEKLTWGRPLDIFHDRILEGERDGSVLWEVTPVKEDEVQG